MRGKRGRDKGRKEASRAAAARRERALQREAREPSAGHAPAPVVEEVTTPDDTHAAARVESASAPTHVPDRITADVADAGPSLEPAPVLTAPVEGITTRHDREARDGQLPETSASVGDVGHEPDALPDAHRDTEPDVSDLPIRDAKLAHFAHTVLATCDECEGGLAAAVAVRQEQEMAWLVLCDRGWPAHQMVPQPAIPVVTEWLACWAEFVQLPVKVQGIRDRFRLRALQSRFEKVEGTLKPMFPAEVWHLVQPLDATGRATFAFILQGIQQLEAIRLKAAESRRLRAQLIARFNTFRAPTQALGIEPPDAPLDTAAWRRIATEADRRARLPG